MDMISRICNFSVRTFSNALLLGLLLAPLSGQAQGLGPPGNQGDKIFLPQVAAGPFQAGGFSGVFSTSVVLNNPGDVTVSANVEFTTPAGQSMTVAINNVVGTQLNESIPAHGVLSLEVTSATELNVGAATVLGGDDLVAHVLYRFADVDGRVRAEAGIEAPSPGGRFSTLVDTRQDFGTGIASRPTFRDPRVGTGPVAPETSLANQAVEDGPSGAEAFP